MGVTRTHDELQGLAYGHLLQQFARNGSFAPGGDLELPVLASGDGACRVTDTRGVEHLDALSGMFCMQLGYGHGEEIAEAAAAQLRSMPYTTNWSTATPTAIELATELARRAPGDISHAFFCGGGSEAVESAWKIVRQHFVQKGEPERHKVIARRTAYHGVNLGALAISGVDTYKAPFGPSALEVRHVANTNRFRQPDGDDDAAFAARLLAEIEAVIQEEGPETVAMISVEPIQNAGGCFTPPEGYWPGLRAICDRYGIILHADEVISGFGRLGEIYGVTRYGGVPDVITLAKGLTSGHVPMGAVMLSERIVDVLREPGCTLMHGLTFGGHPVCAAVAMKSLEIYDREGVLEGVRSRVPFVGDLMRGLLDIPAVGDVRGDGFFWALEVVADEEGSPLTGETKARFLTEVMPRHLRDQRLIARGDGRGDVVVQIAPALVAEDDVIEEIVERLGRAVEGATEELRLPYASAKAGMTSAP
ncbi:MAG: aminotransferase class III-fold pyridoxal phosphate-dependent enzyme [Thermoleophilia bacterium]